MNYFIDIRLKYPYIQTKIVNFLNMNFSTEQLAQLFAHALSYSWRDDGGLSRIAVKACISSNKAVRDVIPVSFEQLKEFPDRNLLRLFLMKLGRMGLVNEFEKLLKHGSADVRFAAVHALANFGGPTHIELVRGLLQDSDVDVRTRAQQAISSMSDAGYQPGKQEPVAEPLNHTDYIIVRLFLGESIGISDNPVLINLLRHKNTEVGMMALQALRDHGEDIAETLFGELPSCPYECAQKVIELLGELHSAPVVEMLHQKILSGGYLTASEINSLKYNGDSSAASVLLSAIANSPFEVGKQALLALEQIEPNTGNLLLEAFQTDSMVRSQCGRLVAMASGHAAIGALIDALSSPFRAVRQGSEEGLLELGVATVSPLLNALEQSSGDAEAHILRILGKIGAVNAFEMIAARTNSPDTEIRRAAVGALVKFQNTRTLEILAREVKSNDWKIREEVAGVLGFWPWHNRIAVELLTDLASNSHPRVYKAAHQSLHDMASRGEAPRELEEKLKSLLQRTDHSDETVRQEANQELLGLKGLYPYLFSRPRIFSPEGSEKWKQLQDRVWNSVGIDTKESLPINFSHTLGTVVGVGGQKPRARLTTTLYLICSPKLLSHKKFHCRLPTTFISRSCVHADSPKTRSL